VAGKSKIVREALEGLSDVAKRWFSSLDEADDPIWGHDSLATWPEFIEKVKNLDEEAPVIFSQYEPRVLSEALAEAAEGHSDLAIINPKDFKMLALRDIEDWLQGGKWFNPDDPVTKDAYERINEYAEMYEKGIKFDHIPFLGVNPSKVRPRYAQVDKHEGRHRMRAQEQIGAEKALVRILRSPDYKIKEHGEDILHTQKSQLPTGRWEGDPYKSVSDVLKFLSLGGGVGALANLTDEDLDF